MSGGSHTPREGREDGTLPPRLGLVMRSPAVSFGDWGLLKVAPSLQTILLPSPHSPKGCGKGPIRLLNCIPQNKSG